MKPLSKPSWKALTLLSIIVPVSLLATFRLTGILPEPEGPVTIAETIMLETVKWESERPDSLINIDRKAQSFYDGEAAIVQSVGIYHYNPNDWTYEGSSSLSLTVNMTTSVQVGYISDIRLTFRENYVNASIDFFEADQLMKLENLSLIGLKDWAQEVFVNMTGKNRPNKVNLWIPIHWVLNSPSNQTHRLDAVSEIVYFNGSVYKKVVQPFLLRIGPDDNNTFQTAMEIRRGNYTGLYLGEHDYVDYYKIRSNEGQRIRVYFNAPWSPPPLFNVYVYNPEGNLTLSMTEPREYYTVDFVSNSTGYWTIKLQRVYAYGFYYIEVS